MIPDSETTKRMETFERRFDAAVSSSFAYLSALGFTRCAATLSGMDDLRDATASHRFVAGTRAIDVHFGFLTFQIQVVLLDFEDQATCERSAKHRQVTDLEEWLRANGRVPPPNLPWMRKGTLWEEMMRSYNRYAKNIDRDMEAAVDLLAQRLRESGLLEDQTRL